MRNIGVSSIPGGRRTLVAAGIVCVALLAVAATPQLLGSDVRRAFAGLEHARPIWLWAAAVGFLGALLCNAWVWRSAIQLCGGGGGTRGGPAPLPGGAPPESGAPGRGG